MLFTNKDYVFKQMQENDLAFYEVLDGNTLLDQNQDENTTVDKSVEQLRECLESLNGSFVTVKVSAVTKKTKATGRDYSLRVYNVKLSTPNNPAQASIAGIGGISDEVKSLMNEISQLKAQLIETEYKNQISGLQEQINDLKNSKADPISDIAQAMIMQYMQPGPQKSIVGIAGVATNDLTGTQSVADDKTRFTAAIQRLKTVDADLISTLESLAAFAEKNPAQYCSYVTMLKTSL